MMSLLSPGTFVGRWTLRSRREPRTAARVTCEVTGPGRVSLCVAARSSGCVGACRLSRAERLGCRGLRAAVRIRCVELGTVA